MKKVIVSLLLGLGVLANANAQGDAEAGKAKPQLVQHVMVLLGIAL